MAPTNEQLAIAASIDKAVSAFPDTAGGMEHLLVRMYKYMPDFKRILDTAAPGDMDMLCAQYPHFYRFAKLMEQLAHLAQSKEAPKHEPEPKPKPASKKPT